jgi:hypothetical protein
MGRSRGCRSYKSAHFCPSVAFSHWTCPASGRRRACCLSMLWCRWEKWTRMSSSAHDWSGSCTYTITRRAADIQDTRICSLCISGIVSRHRHFTPSDADKELPKAHFFLDVILRALSHTAVDEQKHTDLEATNPRLLPIRGSLLCPYGGETGSMVGTKFDVPIFRTRVSEIQPCSI